MKNLILLIQKDLQMARKNKEKRRNYIKNYHQKIKDVEFEEVFGQEEKEEVQE